MPISFRCQPQTACNQLSWNRFLFDDQVLVAVCIALDPTNIYPVNWRFGRLLYVGCYGHDFCGPCWPGGDYYKYCSCTALFSILSFRCRSIHPTRLHANSACGVRWCPWSGVHKLQGEMIGQQGVVQTFADKNWMVQFLTPKCQKNREMRTWFWQMKPSTWDATPTNAILCMFGRVLWVTTNTQHFGSLHLITYLMGAHEMAKRRNQGIG